MRYNVLKITEKVQNGIFVSNALHRITATAMMKNAPYSNVSVPSRCSLTFLSFFILFPIIACMYTIRVQRYEILLKMCNFSLLFVWWCG